MDFSIDLIRSMLEFSIVNYCDYCGEKEILRKNRNDNLRNTKSLIVQRQVVNFL